VVDPLSAVKAEMVLALVVMAVVVMVVVVMADMIRAALLLLDAIALRFLLLLSTNQALHSSAG
jgi:uncharacterized membrane protein YeiH